MRSVRSVFSSYFIDERRTENKAMAIKTRLTALIALASAFVSAAAALSPGTGKLGDEHSYRIFLRAMLKSKTREKRPR